MSAIAFVVSIVVVLCLAVYVIFQLRAIHELVNSRLTEALNEIKRLGGSSDKF